MFSLITSIIASRSNIEPTAAMITAAKAAVGIHLKNSAKSRAEISTTTAVIMLPNCVAALDSKFKLEREKQPETGIDETSDEAMPPTPTAKKSLRAVTIKNIHINFVSCHFEVPL